METIGEFLERRRARLSPEDVGLPAGGTRRRVAGLRREELALLAAVSPDYYTRLEQGRATNVSDQVLSAVAQALRLSATEAEHLMNLARPPSNGTKAPTTEDEFLARLMEAMVDVPAVLLDRKLDVLAYNTVADAVFDLGGVTTPTNAARRLFLHPGERNRYGNWDDIAADTTAQLRLSAGRRPDDPQLTRLIGELAIHSSTFRLLWAMGDARDKRAGVVRVTHPVVGQLEFDYESLSVPTVPDRSMMTYLPHGKASAEAMRVLLSWVADPTPRLLQD